MTTTTTRTTTVTGPRRGSGRGSVCPVWSAADGSCRATGNSPVLAVSSLASPTGASTRPGPASPPPTSSAWPRRPSRPSTPVCLSPLAAASFPSRLLSSAGTRPARRTASAAWSSRSPSSRASSPSGPRLWTGAPSMTTLRPSSASRSRTRRTPSFLPICSRAAARRLMLTSKRCASSAARSSRLATLARVAPFLPFPRYVVRFF